MSDGGINRRELLAAGAAASAGLGLGSTLALASGMWSRVLDFAALGDGTGWPGWTCPGVANVHRTGGHGLIEAGSDVFPCDPRPVAFAVDRRFIDGEIDAVIAAAGAGTGLVLRRTGPRHYYAAVYDDEQLALVLLRRAPDGAHELARATVPRPTGPLHLSLAATGRHPTRLSASIEAGEAPITVSARDGAAALQRPGDPGVLATARTLYPSQGPEALPALGNVHLLPYGVQEGEAVMSSPVGRELLAEIRERSTAAFARITVRASGSPRRTPASVVAATAGAPLAAGAMLRVATDLPARVEIELAEDPAFHTSRRLQSIPTNAFGGAFASVRGLRPGRRVYWRAHLRRHGRHTVGPTQSFRALPRAGSSARVRVAVGACASQFGPIFGHISAQRPDLFVWQGDLNYPDTLGPLAQNVPGYAGIWRDFLANPAMDPIFGQSLFATQRDDHDYGIQDANSTNLVPWGLAPWEALMEPRPYYRFATGLAEFWVLDQRRQKSDPTLPDTPDKTLLGSTQRAWLLRTLATSKAPFKVVCSPCTLAPLSANQRDGSWAVGFTAERDLLLRHIGEKVSGRTIFVTGDTHWTMVYDRDGLFEARPCPLGIPTPNDITLTQPQAAEDARTSPGVLYADDDKSHFALIEVAGREGNGHLDLTMVREDGVAPFTTRFEKPRPAR